MMLEYKTSLGEDNIKMDIIMDSFTKKLRAD